MPAGKGAIGLAIVGCGEVAHEKHLRVLKTVPEARVLALADLDVERARRVAARHGIPEAYASVDPLLERRDVEAIGVCVPPGEHARVGIAVIEAGKHLYMEKPLAGTMEDAEGILNAASRAPGVHLMGFHMRRHRLVRRLKQMLEQGRIGEIESVRVLWFSPRTDESLPQWRLKRSTSGGAICEIGAHCFDLWRHLTGAEVEEVFCQTRCGTRDDEVAVVSGRLTDGTLAAAILSERTTHEIEIEVCGREGRIRAACQRFDGMEFLPSGSAPGQAAVRYRALWGTVRELPRALFGTRGLSDYLGSYRETWRHFCRAVRGTEPPECTLPDGRRALAVTLAALRSAEDGSLQRV